MRRLGAIGLALLAATPGFAQDVSVCDTLIKMAQPRVAAIDPPNGATSCDQYLDQAGAVAGVCYWSFAFRTAEARQFFDTLSDDVQACLAADASTTKDQLVNHPDSFDLRSYIGKDMQVSVSLKDKGALSQTLVFLRVAGVQK